MSDTTTMSPVPGGTFLMGSDRHYPEETPARPVAVDGFRMDAHPVTNAAFAAFVEASGYRTVAERPLDATRYPGADPALLVPGSMVFHPTTEPVDLGDFRHWWAWVPAACWRQPEGPGSDIETRADHPVVHVAYADAKAYARWAAKDLPTEAEWERAARGGRDGAEYVWGDSFEVDGGRMAKTWQGRFPYRNEAPAGLERTAPVGSYPANGYGLFDMAGNVWEWTSDWYAGRHAVPASPCCVPANPRGAPKEASFDPAQPEVAIPRKVVKGGSFLCSPEYCQRYRPAARHAQMIDTGMSHIGFRCVVRES